MIGEITAYVFPFNKEYHVPLPNDACCDIVGVGTRLKHDKPKVDVSISSFFL